MIPIQELFSRIRWDQEFGQGNFEVGYEDHLAHAEIRIPLRNIRFDPGNHFSFHVDGCNGEALTIPFHRVRSVYKNGARIWSR